jgi:outer membrane lipoprotein-sorting protein
MSIFVSSLFPLILAASPGPVPVAPALAASPAPVVVKAIPATPRIQPTGRLENSQKVVVDHPVGGEIVRVQQGPPPAPTPAPAADKQAIIDRAGQALGTVKTAEGRFSQVDAGGAASSGAFYISRPGKIRFEYTAPEPMFIVSDGTTVSIEEPKRRAYDSIPLSQTQLNLFLRSNVDLKQSVKKVETVGGSHFVTLVDRTGEAPGEMILEFRASDFELLGWRAIEGSGDETKVRLSGVKTNVKLKPNLFIVKAQEDREDRR